MGRTREQIQADIDQFIEQNREAWDRGLEKALNAPEMSDAEFMEMVKREQKEADAHWKRWEDNVRRGAPMGRMDPPNHKLYERFLELRSLAESR